MAHEIEHRGGFFSPALSLDALFGFADLSDFDVTQAGPWIWASGTAARENKRVDDTKAMQSWWARIGKDERKRLRVIYLAITRHAPVGLTPKQGSDWWSKIGKKKREQLRDKYDGENLFEQAAGVVSSAAKLVPVVGTTVAAGIDVAKGQGAFKDPVKLLASSVAGGQQIAPFVSKSGISFNKKALQQALQANAALLSAASKGAPAGSMKMPASLPKIPKIPKIPKLPALPKIPDIAKLAKQRSLSARDVAAMMKPVTSFVSVPGQPGLLRTVAARPPDVMKQVRARVSALVEGAGL